MNSTINHLIQNAHYVWQNKLKLLAKEYYFIALLFPLMEEIYHTLSKMRDEKKFLTSILAQEDLQDCIFRHVSEYWSFKLLRAGIVELHIARLLGSLVGKTSAERFDDFIEKLQEPHYQEKIFAKYPIIKQQVTFYKQNYLRNIKMLFNSLEKDFAQIKSLYFNESLSADILLKKINYTGDPHRGGKSVALLYFNVEGQEKIIVYKPRSLKIDRAFYQVITWINKISGNNFFIPKIIMGENYGWYEYIDQQSCATLADVKNYYYQLGGLTAILHALCGSDVHSENIIAHGKHPVIIDLECLLPPKINIDEKNTRQPYHFVFNTMVLPQQNMLSENYAGVDLSAFGALPGQYYVQPGLQAVNVGLDTMSLVRVKMASPANNNLPTLLNESVEPLNYTEEFIQGFTEIYKIFLHYKEEFLQTILPYFHGAQSRLVFRRTYEYAKLLMESYHAKLLTNNEEYLKHFAWLQEEAEQTFKKTLYPHEVADLLGADIPLFAHPVDGVKIIDSSNALVPLKIIQSGYEQVEDHIRYTLSEKDLTIQLAIIKQCFCTYRVNRGFAFPVLKDNKLPSFSPTHQQLKLMTKKLLTEFLHLAVYENNYIAWPSITQVGESGWSVYTERSAALYNGLAGIGLMIAHATREFNEPNYYEILVNIVTTIEKSIEIAQQNKNISLGFFSGVGGLLYFSQCVQTIFPNLLTPSFIEQLLLLYQHGLHTSSEVDIISGLAGGLMGLLSAKTLIEPNAWKNLLQQTAEKILVLYLDPKELLLEKTSIKSKHSLLGCAHGTSGIALALWLCHQQIPNEKSAEWVRRALKYERECYSKDANNWPDYRDIKINNSQQYNSFHWCHGAAGITLARIQMKQAGFNDAHIDTEIANGLNAILKNGFTDQMNLCHGDLGNLDILLCAYQQNLLSENTYQQVFTQVMQQLGDGSQIMTEQGIDTFQAGLLTGHAGIIYQLLRCLNPLNVPSVLSMISEE